MQLTTKSTMTKLSPFHTQKARKLVSVTLRHVAVMVYLSACWKEKHEEVTFSPGTEWVQKCSAMMSQCQVVTDQDKQSQPPAVL